MVFLKNINNSNSSALVNLGWGYKLGNNVYTRLKNGNNKYFSKNRNLFELVKSNRYGPSFVFVPQQPRLIPRNENIRGNLGYKESRENPGMYFQVKRMDPSVNAWTLNNSAQGKLFIKSGNRFINKSLAPNVNNIRGNIGYKQDPNNPGIYFQVKRNNARTPPWSININAANKRFYKAGNRFLNINPPRPSYLPQRPVYPRSYFARRR